MRMGLRAAQPPIDIFPSARQLQVVVLNTRVTIRQHNVDFATAMLLNRDD